MKKHILLFALWGCLLLATGCTCPRPLVGAIRWDAWHGTKGGPGRAVERALGPERWHYRLPFFAEVISSNTVRIPGYTAQIVDQEIAYAHKAGLDYWAFVLYAPNDPMSEALELYLASPHKQDIRFCGISTFGKLWDAQIKRFVGLMQDAAYQKVLDQRPLFYFFCPNTQVGSRVDLRRQIENFRHAARQAGVGNPYLVVMGFDPITSKQLADEVGCDAISSYSAAGNGCGAPFADLAKHAEHYWERCRKAGAKVIPIVMAGHDRRPRVEHPVPWEHYQKPGVGIEKFYQPPTPVELATHLAHAQTWVQQHTNAAESRAIIIYAWNENDEGGWLVPTLSEGTARLDALRGVLRGK